jgi:formylglycine-generating enzyme required for sulfatase activity
MKKILKSLAVGCVTVGAVLSIRAEGEPVVPTVSCVTLTQNSRRMVTVQYTLTNAPAVVTLDIETNFTENATTGWASIGGEHIRSFSPTSAVSRRITENGTHTIQWYLDQDWPDQQIAEGGLRAKVTAWAPDNPPDYMVVDLRMTAEKNSPRFYPAIEFLPGGLLDNHDYRTTKLVMRKIIAKGVTWTMGSFAEAGRKPDATDGREIAHEAWIDDNYYIGVFEITQGQFTLVYGSNPSTFSNPAYNLMRPVENVYYNQLRNSNGQSANSGYYWPQDPHPGSFIGKLRDRTGINGFELTGEAQWEFACRAGNGENFWGDGSAYTSATECPNCPGRAKYNGGYIDGTTAPDNATCTPENGTAIVGSYAPNKFGLYDMHGNVQEFCIDWFQYSNITNIHGAINVDPTNPSVTIDQVGNRSRTIRGGSYGANSSGVRSAYRDCYPGNSRTATVGFRVACSVDLE